MRLTHELGILLKKPLGVLIQGEVPLPYDLLKDTFPDTDIIAIGDVVTENIGKVGIDPILSIVDGKTMRKEKQNIKELIAEADFIVPNPRSTISKELWNTLRDCDFNHRKIFIDGEEDLATLPAIIFAPIGSIVVYGQPDEGIVVVNVTNEKKKEIYSIISKMEGEKWI